MPNFTATSRPAYVRQTFAGKCKCFPAKDALFLPFQKRWIEDDSRLKIMEKSRQIGISWSTAYRLVRKKSAADARADAWVSSRDDLQARLFLEDCKKFADILHAGAKDLGERAIDESGNSAYVLAFANGVRAHSMSSNPDAQAGKRGDRIIDEAALHPDPRKIYDIAYHGITWGGSMELISTHRGSGNFFNSICEEARGKNPKGFSLHTVRLEDALAEGFLYKLQTKLPADDRRQQMDEAEYFNFIRAGCSSEEAFQQECCCNPADDKSAFITYELLDSAACEMPAAAAPAIPTDLPLYAGLDIGRTNDLTVLWLAALVEGELRPLLLLEMQNLSFSEQEARIFPHLSNPNLRRCCIDQTGIGRQFAERARARFGAGKIEGINFSASTKESLAYPLRAALEDRTFRVPRADKVFADFRAIKKETTSSGNVRFSADRGRGGHSDRFWAAALCLHAAAQKQSYPLTITIL